MATDEGFHDFYRDAYPRLVAQLYAVTTDLALAEDVVQEAFVRAASRWPQIQTYQAPEAWVRKVALRLHLDAARRLRRQAAALTRLGARLDPQPALDPENQELVEALRRLPRRYREVLVLHHCLDRSVEDVGAHLGIPTATVKTRLARAGPCSPACSRRRPTNANKEHPMPGTDLGDRLDHLLRTVEDGVTAANPAAVIRRGRSRRRLRRAGAAAAVAALLAGAVLTRAVLVDRPTPVLGPLLVQDATPAQLAGGRWRALPVLPAGQLDQRERAAVVWTGRQLVYWGGASHPPVRAHADGAAFNPDTNQWATLPLRPRGPAEGGSQKATTGSRSGPAARCWSGEAGPFPTRSLPPTWRRWPTGSPTIPHGGPGGGSPARLCSSGGPA